MEKQRFPELLSALSLVLDLGEGAKVSHAWRVGYVAALLADPLAPEIKDQVFYAGLLHDIGAIGLDEEASHHLSRAQELAPAVLSHPTLGEEIVARIPGLRTAAAFVADHHENFDGSGYPRGKRGDQIELGGQLLRAAEELDLYLRAVPGATPGDAASYLLHSSGETCSREVLRALGAVLTEQVVEALKDPAVLEARIRELWLELPPVEAFDPGGTLQVMAGVIDAKHAYTGGHSSRVAEYAAGIAREAGLGPETEQSARWGGLLHDAGKVAIPRRILDKPGRLDPEEKALVRTHPVLTGRILEKLGGAARIKEAACYHHERYDGRGYPEGLAGDRTPLLGRLIAIADCFDALTSARAYRKALGAKDAVSIIRREAGRQFDPDLVRVAAAVLPQLAVEVRTPQEPLRERG